MAYLQGTWFMTLYLRCMGAKIGSWVTFRYCNVQTAPDMLIIGDGTHVGDMANMITACALDAGAVLVAPIDIGKQVGSTSCRVAAECTAKGPSGLTTVEVYCSGSQVLTMVAPLMIDEGCRALQLPPGRTSDAISGMSEA